MSATPPAETPATQRVPAASPAEAAAYFHTRRSFETDVSDVHADIEAGHGGFVLMDSRSKEAWDQGHVPQAVHLPTDDIPERAEEVLDRDTMVVVYCWGPGCNGATRAAHALASLGYRVKEMLGGYEYWVREGFPVADAAGTRRPEVDPLTAPAGSTCGC